MKKTMYIVGACLVIGSITVICMTSKKKSKQSTKDFREELKMEKPLPKKQALAEIVPNEQKNGYKCDCAESEAVKNIYARHKDMAEIVQNSVGVVCKNTKISEKTNQEIDAVSAELDAMLSEE